MTNDAHAVAQAEAGDTTSAFAALGKVFRMMLQSAVLAVGAWLVIRQEASAGIIIACSILSGRALAPLDATIANWKGFVAARQAWGRLDRTLAAVPTRPPRFPLPAPNRSLAVEGVAAAPPGANRPVVAEVRFRLAAGDALCVVGHSAAGKSTLARTLVGLWRPMRGRVELDGAALDQWDAEALGAHLGYLPQEVELIDGTIAENIARFTPEADPAGVVAAARAAGVHDLVVALPEGYETRVGERGAALAAGQRQRIALARALWGDPFLVVLDEPNSNLDADGEAALTRAVEGVRARGGIVVMVTHRLSALAAATHVLALSGGTQQNFGPRDEMLAAKPARREPAPTAPLKVVPQPQREEA